MHAGVKKLIIGLKIWVYGSAILDQLIKEKNHRLTQSSVPRSDNRRAADVKTEQVIVEVASGPKNQHFPPIFVFAWGEKSFLLKQNKQIIEKITNSQFCIFSPPPPGR